MSEERDNGFRLAAAGLLLFLLVSVLLVVASFRFRMEPTAGFRPGPTEASVPPASGAAPAGRAAPEAGSAGSPYGSGAASGRAVPPGGSVAFVTSSAGPSRGSGAAPEAPSGRGERGPAPLDGAKALELGSRRGLLSGMAGRILGRPALIRAVFNNKLVVKAYMGRELVRKNCSSPRALKAYLMDGASPEGVREELSIMRSFLRRPESAMAFAGTELMREIVSCPSVSALAKDAGAAQEIAMSNPDLLSLAADPAALRALQLADPKAYAAFQKASSSLPR